MNDKLNEHYRVCRVRKESTQYNGDKIDKMCKQIIQIICGLLKIHKPRDNIKQMVSNINVPTYKLATNS